MDQPIVTMKRMMLKAVLAFLFLFVALAATETLIANCHSFQMWPNANVDMLAHVRAIGSH